MQEIPKDKASEPVSSVDFYWDNGFMVFTESYHRKRGYCCQSGCRHCPYDFLKGPAAKEQKGF